MAKPNNYKPRPPKRPENEQQKPINEFNSYISRSVKTNSVTYSFNLLDLYSPEQLSAIVKDPMGNNEILREISLTLYGTNGSYTNVVDYMTSLPTLSKVVVPHGKSENKKKQNKEKMDVVLRSIKDKEIVRDALFKGMVEGLAFYYFETIPMPVGNRKTLSDIDVNSIVELNDLGMNVSVIPLPVDYTRIVGRKNSSYVIAFNLDYFLLNSTEPVERKLRKYPKEIRDAYYRHQKNGLKDNGNWIILDCDHTLVHKVRSKINEPFGRPLVLAAINDILYRDYFTGTKRGVLDDINNRIIYQTFPEGKDKGTSALTKTQQEHQHSSVKSAVMTKNNRGGISFFSVAAGTKINQLETNNTDIFDEKNEADLDNKISLALGFAGNALSGSGSGSYSAQQTNLELVTSQVFQWVEQIEAELNKCINACVIKDSRNWVEVKYLPITYLNKKSMVQYAKELYLQGCGSLSLWIAACGVDPEVQFALCDQEIENLVYERYKPHQTSFTLSSKDTSESKGGRPQTDDPTDNTIISRDNGSNNLITPADK